MVVQQGASGWSMRFVLSLLEVPFSGKLAGGGSCLNFVWATDLWVRAVTPLAVLLCLGSRPTYPSCRRAVRLQSWLGFNALIGLTGTLNNIWEVYSKPSCVIALRTLRAISFA